MPIPAVAKALIVEAVDSKEHQVLLDAVCQSISDRSIDLYDRRRRRVLP